MATMSSPKSRNHSRTQSTLRYSASVVLSVLAGVSLLLASVGIWVNNSIFDSKRFADTVEDVLDEPTVNTALSRYVVDQLMATLDVQQTITDRLPDEFEGAAVLLVGALRNVVEDAVRTVLAEERVRELVGDQVEITHELFMNVLEDQGPFGSAVTTQGNQVVLDLKPVFNRVLDNLERGDILRERIDLPEDFGKLVVYEGDAVESSSVILRTAQDTLSLYKRLLILFIVAAPLLTIAAIYIASSRRHAVRRLGIVFAAVAAAVLAVVSRIGPALDNLIRNPDANAAAGTIADVFLQRLVRFNWLLLLIAVVLIVVATFYNQLMSFYSSFKQSRLSKNVD
jgi:hypothetical protein